MLPHKFEAGTPNVADAVGLAAACEYLDGIGMAAVRTHEQELTVLATEKLLSIPEVRVYGPAPEQRSGVVSFTVGDIHPHDLATILDEVGVCIRAGHHCAQPLMRRLNVPATARASFYVYNTASEVDALVSGVERARRFCLMYAIALIRYRSRWKRSWRHRATPAYPRLKDEGLLIASGRWIRGPVDVAPPGAGR